MTVVRTRFAPSPTGSLHVGGVRTALYCMLYAKKHGGSFVLRIEDTDQARSTTEAAVGLLRDLRWCGLDWDEGPGKDGEVGPYYQSERLHIYDRYVEQLLLEGTAYHAWESKSELEALREAAKARKENFAFRRRTYTDEQIASFEAEKRVPVVRIEAPKHDVVINDAILGDVSVAETDLEDIVIRKADGFPTYHFAVVIDDALMGITQILRGAEHLKNTHKHAGIALALGWRLPRVGHLPLIFNPAGQKMSKREKAQTAREAARKEHVTRKLADYAWLAELSGVPLDEIASFMKKENDRIATAEAIATVLRVELPLIEVMDFRKGGYIPEALINYMALLGWNPGDDREILSVDEMVAAFSLDRVNHTAARFDPEKLKWMNGEYLRRLHAANPERLAEVLDAWLEVVDSPIARLDRAQQMILLGMYRDRAATLVDVDRLARFFFERPAAYDEKAVKKWLLGNDGLAVLATCADALAACAWDVAGIEVSLAAIADGNVGHVAQPLRVAITGTAVSPPIYDTLAFLSRDEVLARIAACLAAVRA